MQTMRRTVYPLSTPGGEVKVTVYRDLHQAFVIFEGPHAFNRIDLLAARVRELYLHYLPEESICWVVRQTSRLGNPIIRQVEVRWKDGQATHPLAQKRTPEELQAVLEEIDRDLAAQADEDDPAQVPEEATKEEHHAAAP